jgi:hypothetical protein
VSRYGLPYWQTFFYFGHINDTSFLIVDLAKSGAHMYGVLRSVSTTARANFNRIVAAVYGCLNQGISIVRQNQWTQNLKGFNINDLVVTSLLHG